MTLYSILLIALRFPPMHNAEMDDTTALS